MQNDVKEDKILIKILRQEKRYGMNRLLAEFPNKHWHLALITVKRLQRKIDNMERSTGNLTVKENEKFKLNKNIV